MRSKTLEGGRAFVPHATDLTGENIANYHVAPVLALVISKSGHNMLTDIYKIFGAPINNC